MNHPCFKLNNLRITRKLLIFIIMSTVLPVLFAQSKKSEPSENSNTLIFISQHASKEQGFLSSIDSIKMGDNKPFSAEDSINKFSVTNIRTRPTGALVFIDSVYVGKSPLSLKAISPCKHLLHCELKDFKELSTNFDVDSGFQQTLILTLLPTFGTLSLTSKPEEVFVTIDSISTTYSPLADIKLAVGTHIVSISHPTYEEPIYGSFYIYPGYKTEIEVGEKSFHLGTMLCSMILPGLGQIIDESYLKGSLEMAFALGAAYYLSDSYSNRNQRESNYELAKTKYNVAANENEAIMARTNMMLGASDLDRANNRLTGSYWLLVK